MCEQAKDQTTTTTQEAKPRTREEIIKTAEYYLLRHNFDILDVDWHAPQGQMDIIGMDRGTLAFVKVHYLGDKEFPEEPFITPKERRRFENTALAYLVCNDFDGSFPMRFDVIHIRRINDDQVMMRHVVNAK